MSEFSARFSSALLSVGTVFLTFLIGRRLYGGEAGLWSGLVLACTLMFSVVSRAATPDATFIFCSTLAFWLFIEGVARQQRRLADAGTRPLTPADGHNRFLQTLIPATPLLWLSYAALGLAVLAKGPAGWLLPSLVLVSFLLAMLRLNEPADGRETLTGPWCRRTDHLGSSGRIRRLRHYVGSLPVVPADGLAAGHVGSLWCRRTASLQAIFSEITNSHFRESVISDRIFLAIPLTNRYNPCCDGFRSFTLTLENTT